MDIIFQSETLFLIFIRVITAIPAAASKTVSVEVVVFVNDPITVIIDPISADLDAGDDLSLADRPSTPETRAPAGDTATDISGPLHAAVAALDGAVLADASAGALAAIIGEPVAVVKPGRTEALRLSAALICAATRLADEALLSVTRR